MKILKDVKLKPLDIIILAVLVMVSFFPLTLFANSNTVPNQVIVRAHGKVVKTLELSVNQVWTYKDNGDYNRIQVKDNKVRVQEANCRDLIDVKAGWISKNGQTLVCLPHSLVVALTGNGPVKQDGKVVDYQ
ncbi:NusG domain II-containing protein [Lactovum miscens]|uniref:NusG domain-containing protein n=1 Tax=Lactovum miscens TaxID=190387 RepID=A0A841C6F3_9LACT|nr:NusG domain II-containing protein [Lactovum miscens]MBB5887847.1 hypothetical protein [Lactovum miscens]